MNKRLWVCALLWCMIVTVLCLSGTAFGESYEASTMRLLRYEGDVVIEDASGNPRFVLENVRFNSGEAMKTGENSSASVSLDATKILTLDAETRVEFEKDGDHLVLNLTAGTLLLDVQEKLDENESLDIRTSTMTIGIRGTILYVTTLDRVPDPGRRIRDPDPVLYPGRVVERPAGGDCHATGHQTHHPQLSGL